MMFCFSSFFGARVSQGMRRSVTTAVVGIGCAVIALAARPANAQLLGSSVTGTLTFVNSTNYFLASNGYVPTGYGNSSPNSNTVVIAEPIVEFGFYNNDTITDTANFTNTQLIVTTTVNPSTSIAPFVMTFTSTAFGGATFTKVSDTFFGGGVSASLTNNTINFSAPGGQASGTYQAVFNVIPKSGATAPEPDTFALLGCGIASGLPIVGAIARKRKRSV